jgi:hypothetical protein
MKLMICNHAGTKHCKKQKYNEFCFHRKKHKEIITCDELYCGKIKVKCIPYQNNKDKGEI